MGANDLQKGFILQSTYRVRQGVPVIYLFGRLDNGETFLIRDNRERPHFYVLQEQAEATEKLLRLGQSVTDSTMHSAQGEPLTRVQVAIPADAPELRERLHTAGVRTWEADIRFATSYLINRGLRGSLIIEGEARDVSSRAGYRWLFNNPQLRPADGSANLSVLAFDIETDPFKDNLLAISFYGCGLDEVLIVDPAQRSMPDKAIGLPNEQAVLERFSEVVRNADPDILTGWNVVNFDLAFLLKIARRHNLEFNLGRISGPSRIRDARSFMSSSEATIPGRLILDGPDLIRGASIRMDEYSLDAVSRNVLGEGKAVEGDVKDRLAEILDGYHNNLPRFAHYARTDSRLVIDILERLDLIPLAQARSKLTGMPLDRIAASIASFDFVYLSRLHQQGIAAPTLVNDADTVHTPQAGGHVFSPVTGLHQHTAVFDFKSLYPSLMRTFNIDPISFRETPHGDDIAMVSGCGFSRQDGLLPRILTELFAARAHAKNENNAIASQAIKILMNSFYGVLGTPACRFYNPAIANAITRQGRYFLEWARNWFETQGYAVLYGDTDSVFVAIGMPDPQQASDTATKLCERINTDLQDHINARWQRTSHLELEYEKLYEHLLLPSARGQDSRAGARKRYAGLQYKADTIEFVGMEAVRRDWTTIAKQVQLALYTRLFNKQPVADYLKNIVAEVRDGKHDEALVYMKNLRKPVEEYTASSPPHVVAARKSTQTGRVIRYVMTEAGPEPLDNRTADLDREHYIQKQIKPVSEPVLAARDQRFDEVIGDNRQFGLF